MRYAPPVENTPEAWSRRGEVYVDSWEAAGWSQRGQRVRFEAVRELLDLHSGETLLDFGCGTGDFSLLIPADVGYHAWDWAPGMRERTRSSFPRAHVHDELPLESFDHIVCIGTFNLPGSYAATRQQLSDLWSQTRRSLTASLYRGDNPNCLRYDWRWVLGWGRSFPQANRVELSLKHLPNDLLFHLER